MLAFDLVPVLAGFDFFHLFFISINVIFSDMCIHLTGLGHYIPLPSMDALGTDRLTVQQT